MRTTLDIDPDVLAAAKEMASRSRSTAGQIISELARRSLVFNGLNTSKTPSLKNGFEVLPANNRLVTPELVEKLMNESET